MSCRITSYNVCYTKLLRVDGQLRPYLQPILLGANALAKTLLGQPTELALPNMLVKVKTPIYPLQLSYNFV